MVVLLLGLFQGCHSRTESVQLSPEYKSVSFEELVRSPSRFAGHKIRIIGIYRGRGDSLLFADDNAYRIRDRKSAVFVNATHESLPTNKKSLPAEGKLAIAEGKFSKVSDDEVAIYIGVLEEVKLLAKATTE